MMTIRNIKWNISSFINTFLCHKSVNKIGVSTNSEYVCDMLKGFNYKKATQALNFFAIKENGRIYKLKAIKLVWLADRLHLRRFGRTITGDKYFAMEHGMVPSTTRDLLENYNLVKHVAEYVASTIKLKPMSNLYFSGGHLDTDVFSETDLEILNEIWAAYGIYERYVLRDHAHKFPEWKPYEKRLKEGNLKSYEVNTLALFENMEDESGLFVEDEFIDIAKENYLQRQKTIDLFL